jgi:uncharacterized repeat protein (TIGR03803 family)
MESLGLGRFALAIGVATALLTGCGGSRTPIGAPDVMPVSNTGSQARMIAHRIRTASSSYQVLYTFGARPDGQNPLASLINVGSTLYGTTFAGGANNCGNNVSCGTVFSITPDGKEQVLYSFAPGRGGFAPQASLIDVGRTLYGTTSQGGRRSNGTVFRISTTGRERTLHDFNHHNGSRPEASLVDANGTLYGTTFEGGANNCRYASSCGTVFSITPDKLLYRFRGSNYGDGALPVASLINVSGTLYGTTIAGGAYGGGTVFSISTSGTETVLHSFGNGSDGKNPTASLVDVNGTLYGTTFEGGAHSCGTTYDQYDCGTVFSISTTGAEQVLYSFAGPNHGDGSLPEGSLINVSGTLYGTTCYGGQYGFGTVFRVTLGGTEKVLHSFAGEPDGECPSAGLIDVNGTLYGTTVYGGAGENGTVFALTP